MSRFETLRDTVRCLVPYHVMACGTDDDDDVQKGDNKIIFFMVQDRVKWLHRLETCKEFGELFD